MNLLDDARWRCVRVDPASVDHPDGLPGDEHWLPVRIPGTAAGAIRDAEGAAAARASSPDGGDWWFVTDVDVSGCGPWRLTFDGLATLAHVWVNGVHVASSESMFVPSTVVLDSLPPTARIAIRCASLDSALRQRRPRGRWRSSLISAQGLRWFRTTVLGRAPVFGAVPAPVGPWRPVRLVDSGEPVVLERSIRMSMQGSEGIATVEVVLAGLQVSEAVLEIDGATTRARPEYEPDGTARLRMQATISEVRRWWPHTYGVPHLYAAHLVLDGHRVALGSIGFRTVGKLPGDGFGLRINDVEVFSRGLVWTPTDPIALNDRAGTRRTLERCVTAGVDMIRIPGTMVYEDDEFYSLCAELGITVWQDVMLATTDPPDDPHFRTLLEDELRSLARRLGGNPAVVVMCGGSETEQQPAMLGSRETSIEALESWLPVIVSRELPGVVWVSSSPSAAPGGDALPMGLGTGVAHYFGVGGYRRPLGDVRAAGVRFATECLAFATPPSDTAIEVAFGSVNVAGHHPRWKAAVPRDNGASWDFEDVRDHYVRTIFGVDPSEVRWADPARCLALGRAAVCEAFTEVLQYWRRSGSGCAGALILSAHDLQPGAGWGVLDADGNPKAPWWVLARIFAPVTVLLTEDGLDGLRIDAINDTADVLDVTLQLQAHTPSGALPVDVSLPLHLGPHERAVFSWATVTGGFTDVNFAYRFGPRTFETATARLLDSRGATISESVHLVGGPARAVERAIGLRATARPVGREWRVHVETDAAAQYVQLDIDGADLQDSWFHLPPGGSRTVAVRPSDSMPVPRGRVSALNSATSAPIHLAAASGSSTGAGTDGG
ncbi:glycosyl hydrolase 2 galactose-binding domain-containing protein [Rhodococcus sp. CH91]|uniref:glycosyl hydrolase 2 galactose-binding domain-containing protein n=1 Tax=Rhodococcus sp. CH91 TaxID=2910256 RepID=UPI001F4B9A6D|nr:glycoside hydrolase family 2 protein [Rhodococcus sp. CH91]